VNVPENHHLAVREGFEGALVEMVPFETISQGIADSVNQVIQQHTVAVGYPNKDIIKRPLDSKWEMAEQEDISVSAYGIYWGNFFQLGDYLGRANIAGMQDGLDSPFFEDFHQSGMQLAGPVRDVGIGQYTQDNISSGMGQEIPQILDAFFGNNIGSNARASSVLVQQSG